jgi:hypothetical protein
MHRSVRVVVATAVALVMALGAPVSAQAAPKAIDGNAKVFKLTVLVKRTSNDYYGQVQKVERKLGKDVDLWIRQWEPVGNKLRISLIPTPESHKAAIIRAATPRARRILASYGKVTATQFYELYLIVTPAKGSPIARDDFSAQMTLHAMAPANQCSYTSEVVGGPADLICQARVTVAQYRALRQAFAKLAGQPISKVKVKTY